MATTVKIIEYGTQNELTLDSYQRDLFLREIRRVRGAWLTIVLREFFALFGGRVRPVRVRPDCQIIVDKNGRITEYLLHGEFVLYKKGSRVNHQFFMGVLLEYWLGIFP